MTSNINTPVVPCFVRKDVISNEQGYLPCEIFAAKIALNNALTFHIMLESGVIYNNLPISSFVWNENAEDFKSDELETIQQNLSWWDSQGSSAECIVYWYLHNCEAVFTSRNKSKYRGKYLFTIEEVYNSTYPFGYANDKSVKGHHVLQLENGYFAISPNTFLRWDSGDNFVDWNVDIPKLKTNHINVSSELKNN